LYFNEGDMQIESERIDVARWILERNIAWIAAAEAKVGFLVALDTAMFAGLATAYSGASNISPLQQIASLFAFFLLTVCFVCAGMVVRSQTDGPAASIVFFGRIANKHIADYRQDLLNMPDTALLIDLADQIHRNAEIAAEKHRWTRRTTVSTMFAGALWAVAVCLLVRG
jgi:hypothetical protein